MDNFFKLSIYKRLQTQVNENKPFPTEYGLKPALCLYCWNERM